MDGRLTWTDCDEAGNYVVPNVLSPRDLVSRPDNMDETVPHTQTPVILVTQARTHTSELIERMLDNQCNKAVKIIENPVHFGIHLSNEFVLKRVCYR